MAGSNGFAISLLCLSLHSVAGDIASGHHNLVPTVKYQVDLDQPPKERWVPILENFKDSVPLMLEYYHGIVRLHTRHRWPLSTIVDYTPDTAGRCPPLACLGSTVSISRSLFLRAVDDRLRYSIYIDLRLLHRFDGTALASQT